MDRIVCAAIRFDFLVGERIVQVVVPGVRHYDKLMHRVIERMQISEDVVSEEQGFVDNHGTFHSREDALEIAYAANQVRANKCSPVHKLFSEDLY